MKKALIGFTALALLLGAVAAYAQWGPMMRGAFTTEEQKIFDETLELRKDLHLKRFEFREALRKGEYQKAEALEKEIEAISEKLEAKLGPIMEKRGPVAKRGWGRGYGYGTCGGQCGPCW